MTRAISLLIILFFSQLCLAEERIISFHSDIEVLANGELLVTEHITVKAEGKKINRGIYRDFPTKYKDHLNNHYQVSFHVEALLRNGKPEAWHQSPIKNGVRTYFGRKDQYLKKGKHTYQFSYRTNRQLGFFEQHDELYWNVTGNDWDFRIEKASARVGLPGNVPEDDIILEAYTGKQFSKGQDYYSDLDNEGRAVFETSQPLPLKHGLTIVVGFPKGYVTEPSDEQKLQWLLEDNQQLLYLLGGVILLLLYYAYTWHKVGRDPESGVIITQYTPPKGYSPASMRFIEKMAYDKTCFTAALINLAVKGFLKIEGDGKDFTLIKQPKHVAKLAPGEAELSKELFLDGDTIKMEQENHQRFSAAQSAQKASLKEDYEKIYFFTNTGYHIFGALISLLVLIVSLFADPNGLNPEVLFLLVWLTGWTFGVVFLVKSAFLQWLKLREGILNVFQAMFITAFAFPFVSAEIFVLSMLASQVSYVLIFVIFLVIAINWIFYELLKAPTLIGRQLLDKVEGFRHYIEVAEKNELEMRYAPEKTPERFEEYLPYAIALGMETQWANIFSGALADLAIQGKEYHPSWYSGSHWHPHEFHTFASNVSSSLDSAVASSSSAPGSSSGGGGGGFSGGGGGGGGGGGW